MEEKVNLASLVLLKDGDKILMIRKCKDPYKGLYTLPSGKVEEGETFVDTAIRETGEEVGVVISRDDLKVSHKMHRKAEDGSGIWNDTFFITEKWSGEVENKEPEKCDDVSWFDINNLPENIAPFVKFAIENIKENKSNSEFGF